MSDIMHPNFYEAVFSLFSSINESESWIFQRDLQPHETLIVFLVYAIDLQTISARAAYMQPNKSTNAKL